MRGLLLSFATVVLLLQSAPAAQAWKFGAEERLRFLENVNARGPRGEALYLGYKTTVQNVLLGISIKDDGYVLGVKGDSHRYYRMPPAEELVRLQRSGALPDPLPRYRLDLMDYTLGFLAWPVLFLVLLVTTVTSAIKRAVQPRTNDWAARHRAEFDRLGRQQIARDRAGR